MPATKSYTNVTHHDGRKSRKPNSGDVAQPGQDGPLPKIAKPIFNQFPGGIPRGQNRYVLWRYERRKGAPKPTKVLLRPLKVEDPSKPHSKCICLRRASSTNPEHWIGGGFARRIIEASWGEDVGFSVEGYGEEQLGFGIVLNGDGLTSIDLDNCLDEEGELTPEARHVVKMMNTYSEVSPSGRGPRLFFWATLPEGHATRNQSGHYPKVTMDWELYSTGRFLTVTGNKLSGVPDRVENRDEEVRQLYQRLTGETPEETVENKSRRQREASEALLQVHARAYAVGLDSSDEAVLEWARLCSKFERLWNGDRGDYLDGDGRPDPSRADLALMVYLARATRCDASQMERLFRRSSLGQDPQRQHKLARKDYLPRTIEKAIQAVAGNRGSWRGAMQSTPNVKLTPEEHVLLSEGLDDVKPAVEAEPQPCPQQQPIVAEEEPQPARRCIRPSAQSSSEFDALDLDDQDRVLCAANKVKRELAETEERWWECRPERAWDCGCQFAVFASKEDEGVGFAGRLPCNRINGCQHCRTRIILQRAQRVAMAILHQPIERTALGDFTPVGDGAIPLRVGPVYAYTIHPSERESLLQKIRRASKAAGWCRATVERDQQEEERELIISEAKVDHSARVEMNAASAASWMAQAVIEAHDIEGGQVRLGGRWGPPKRESKYSRIRTDAGEEAVREFLEQRGAEIKNPQLGDGRRRGVIPNFRFEFPETVSREQARSHLDRIRNAIDGEDLLEEWSQGFTEFSELDALERNPFRKEPLAAPW